MVGRFRKGFTSKSIDHFPNKAIDVGEWLICGGGRLERFYYIFLVYVFGVGKLTATTDLSFAISSGVRRQVGRWRYVSREHKWDPRWVWSVHSAPGTNTVSSSS